LSAGRRLRITRLQLALAVVLASVAGGAVAIGVGKAAGWLDGGETVVLRAAALPAPPDPALEAAVRPLDGERFDPVLIYRQRSPGAVTIYTLFPGHGEGAPNAQAQGSGFVVSPEGYILTNSHVITTSGEAIPPEAIEAATDVFVEFSDGARVSAEIVGWDLFDDVGLLKVDPSAHPLSPVPLGDSSRVVVGEPVAAIGSPFGQVGSLAVGVVSATERAVDSLTSDYSVVDAIQTDAPINRGNSGGPLFNARGEVIGINAQIRTESGNAEGVGFAIPINSAKRSMEQLIESGQVRYAWVGISTQTVTASLARELGLESAGGAAIQTVVPGSPAAEAGLRAGTEAVLVEGVDFLDGGDVVVAIDGEEVRSTEDLIRIVTGRLFPGVKAEFTVLRDGERIRIGLVLADRPLNPDVGP
jgi:S1-C subfamily serine protease